MKQFCSVFLFFTVIFMAESVKKNAGIRDDRMINVHAKDAPNNPCARSLSISENRKVSRYRAIRITAPASAKMRFAFFHKKSFPVITLLLPVEENKYSFRFEGHSVYGSDVHRPDL